MAGNRRPRNSPDCPVIGISPYYYSLQNAFWMATKETYVHRIWDHGAMPFLLTHPNSNGSVSDIANFIDGLMLIGGPDLPVDTYGGTPYDLQGEAPMHLNRISFDREIFESCHERGKPILAICAGFQHINVIHGGTLIEDIASQVPASIDHGEFKGKISYHSVTVDRHSHLFQILGEEQIFVNGTHHQGIRDLGDGLRASAVSEDGLIEAIEPIGALNAGDNTEASFIGVQWHPELMDNDPSQKKLFQWLVSEAEIQPRRSR
ncbi:MAG: gamma-glutamyl-gamma-aminobutyrate hydrolase family protein [Fidelibacterota bacterium]